MAGVLAVLMSLTACADDSAPPAAPGDQPDAASSVLPSAVPAPVADPKSKQRDDAGAEQFVRYWFQALDYATQTGDITRLTAASGAGCRQCESLISSVRQNYNDGGYLQGGTHTVRSADAEEFAPDDRPMIVVSFDRSSRSAFGPDGQVRGSLPAATFVSCQVTVAWQGNGWRVATITGETLPT